MKAGTWHVKRPTKQVEFSVALAAWTEACIPVLQKVASRYGATITYSELQDQLFGTTGYETRMLSSNWMGKMLDKVVERTIAEDLGPLTSLVVHKGDGAVGSGYYNAEHPQGSIEDPHQLELLAAEDRIACHRRYCADVPADAKPELTKTYQFRTGHRPRVQKTAPDPKFCPEHHLQLRPNGVCDYCD